jgi:hypothetical protein
VCPPSRALSCWLAGPAPLAGVWDCGAAADCGVVPAAGALGWAFALGLADGCAGADGGTDAAEVGTVRGFAGALATVRTLAVLLAGVL